MIEGRGPKINVALELSRFFSTFCCINLKQQVEKTQKSAEAGCLNLFKFAQLFIIILLLLLFVQCCKKSKVERT